MAAADSPPTGTVVEKYNKSIEELNNFITSLSADAHVSIKPLITGSINIDDNAKLNTFSQGIIDALTTLQIEKFEGSTVPKYPYAGNAIEEIKKIQVAAVAPAEILPEAAEVKGRKVLQWFRFYGNNREPFKDTDDDNDIITALQNKKTKSEKGIMIEYKTLPSSEPSIRAVEYATYRLSPDTPTPPVMCINSSESMVVDDHKRVIASLPTSGGKKSRQSRSRNRNRNRNRSNSAHGSKRR